MMSKFIALTAFYEIPDGMEQKRIILNKTCIASIEPVNAKDFEGCHVKLKDGYHFYTEESWLTIAKVFYGSFDLTVIDKELESHISG
jgi:hypothetical protein